MASKSDDIKRLNALLLSKAWAHIGAVEWALLRERFPNFSETTLRKALDALHLKIEQPWRGVDLHSLDGLEETLSELAEVYSRQPAVCRKEVIAAKDKARFAARNGKAAPGKRALKQEMVDWMLVWLGDPAMFATWAKLRKKQLSSTSPRQP